MRRLSEKAFPETSSPFPGGAAWLLLHGFHLLEWEDERGSCRFDHVFCPPDGHRYWFKASFGSVWKLEVVHSYATVFREEGMDIGGLVEKALRGILKKTPRA